MWLPVEWSYFCVTRFERFQYYVWQFYSCHYNWSVNQDFSNHIRVYGTLLQTVKLHLHGLTTPFEAVCHCYWKWWCFQSKQYNKDPLEATPERKHDFKSLAEVKWIKQTTERNYRFLSDDYADIQKWNQYLEKMLKHTHS